MAESSSQPLFGNIFRDAKGNFRISFTYIKCPECHVESRSGNIHKPECTNNTNASGASAKPPKTALTVLSSTDNCCLSGLPGSKSAMPGAIPAANPAANPAAKPPETQ